MKDLDAIEIVATCKANLGWRSMPNLAEGIANGRDVPPLSLAKDEAAEVKIDNAKTLESAAKSWSGRGYFLCAGGYYYLAADEIRRVRTIFAYGQPRTLQSLDTLSDLILMEGAYLFASAENFCNEREQGVGRHLARIHLSEVGGDAYSELYRRLEGMDDFERRENKRLGDRTRFTIKARDEAHFAYSYCIQALRRKCIVDEIREADIKAKMLLTT